MAGFSNIGEPGYQLSPSIVGPSTGGQGYAGISVNRPTRQVSPYFSPGQYQMPNAADTSAEHRANVFMAQNGVGDTYQQRTPGLADYGFSAEDWANVNRYMTNPQNPQNVQGYMNIRNRLNVLAMNSPQFSTWLPEQKGQFATDFPIRMAAGYGLVPPPILQTWGLPYPSSQQPNLRY
jgi:hypothetical protein